MFQSLNQKLLPNHPKKLWNVVLPILVIFASGCQIENISKSQPLTTQATQPQAIKTPNVKQKITNKLYSIKGSFDHKQKAFAEMKQILISIKDLKSTIQTNKFQDNIALLQTPLEKLLTLIEAQEDTFLERFNQSDLAKLLLAIAVDDVKDFIKKLDLALEVLKNVSAKEESKNKVRNILTQVKLNLEVKLNNK